MTGLKWLSVEDACDLLRVSTDNTDVIEQIAESIPLYVEVTTGYPSTCTIGAECDVTVKQLCRFILTLWFDPDGTDATRLTRVVTSLTKVVKALVIARNLGED